MAGPEAADEIQLCMSLPPQMLLCQWQGPCLGLVQAPVEASYHSPEEPL